MVFCAVGDAASKQAQLRRFILEAATAYALTETMALCGVYGATLERAPAKNFRSYEKDTIFELTEAVVIGGVCGATSCRNGLSFYLITTLFS